MEADFSRIGNEVLGNERTGNRSVKGQTEENQDSPNRAESIEALGSRPRQTFSLGLILNITGSHVDSKS